MMFDVKWTIGVIRHIVIIISNGIGENGYVKSRAPKIKFNWSNIGAGLPCFIPNLLFIKLPIISPKSAPEDNKNPKKAHSNIFE